MAEAMSVPCEIYEEKWMMSGDRNGCCTLTDSPDRRLGTNRFVPDVSPFIDPAYSPLVAR